MRVALILLVTLALIAIIQAAPGEGKKGKSKEAGEKKNGKSVKAGKTADANKNKKGSRGMGSDDDEAPARESRSVDEPSADPVAEHVRKAREAQEAAEPAAPDAVGQKDSRLLTGILNALPGGTTVTGTLGKVLNKKKKKPDDEKK